MFSKQMRLLLRIARVRRRIYACKATDRDFELLDTLEKQLGGDIRGYGEPDHDE